jgi:pimeloyl-ACP methyl ester carboxylesterase
MLSPVHSIAEAQGLIQSLQVPVYAIAGSCDKALYMAEALRPWLKRLVTVHEAGHALPWTHGDVCVEVLGEFLEH